METLDIEVVKEKYREYKTEHYEDEREMRKLLKIKKLVPSMANDDKWQKDYETLNDSLADGLYYYNELKKMLSEEEFKKFIDKVKLEVMEERYKKFDLNQYEKDLESKIEEIENTFEEILKEGQAIIPKEFDKSLFAKSVLEVDELTQKAEIICEYQKSTISVFFDITSILKAEIARLLIERIEIEEVDKNTVLTACLVYAFKRTNTPKEIERIKKEKEEDKEFLKSLGFDERFCKICSEYNRYNEPTNYEREKEGDILELVDKFVGLIMHREDRLAFPVEEALDLLNTKILSGTENQYKNKFTQFITDLEKIKVSRDVGVITYFADCANKMKRKNILGILEVILKIRNLLGDSVGEQKLLKLERIEKIQDKYLIVQFLQNLIMKLKEKITSMSKILKGYKKLSEGNQKEDILDR